eukprot:TRINITY_DN3024_c0_g1_i1.p1 TRINITY_DN3024_c0_g1~~TRINITY_DN3024_c0_g1_i1.p1  ORF type:complete len:569 (-),score=98.64 TRINITY_DN3024_c0_g1_i1:344-2026(-)
MSFSLVQRQPATVWLTAVAFLMSLLLLQGRGTGSTDCYKEPTNPACATFKMPVEVVTKDITMACNMMPSMPGCTIDTLCETAPESTGDLCQPFSILKDVCSPSMAKMMGCSEHYAPLCFTNDTVVEECKMPFVAPPSMMTTKELVGDICQEMPKMTGCSTCFPDGKYTPCDLLTIYSDLCLQMPMMKQCATHKDLCKRIPEWPLCTGDPWPKSPAPSPGPSPTPTTTEMDCYQNSSQSKCEKFVMPTAMIKTDIETACLAMPTMPACTIDSICEASTMVDNTYCHPFSLLKDVCSPDMARMSGCREHYTPLCAEGSVVEECMMKSLSRLPEMAQARTDIKSICDQMSMEGCDQCVDTNGKMKSCDLLQVYSDLCLAMPDMKECDAWHSMCSEIPGWGICGGTLNGKAAPPEMRMYWHSGIVDYVLFKEIVPRTGLQYFGILVACALNAVIYEALKAYIGYLENGWKDEVEASLEQDLENVNDPLLRSALVQKVIPAFDIRRDGLRALLHALYMALHYWVMLITMTFNVGLFISVIVGHAIGSLAFGRFARLNPYIDDCCK